MEPRSQVLPPELDGPRPCGVYDLSAVLDTLNLVNRVLETSPRGPIRRPTVGFDWGHVYVYENLENVRIITHKGRVVSSVAIYPGVTRTPRGSISVGGINSLVTHPDYRRRGLGAAVMKDAHEKMRSNGHHIGLLRTVIQDYYSKFGWENAGRDRNFVFDKGNVTLLPDPEGLEITENWRPHVAELVALHDREPMADSRTAELFAVLVERRLQRLFVARRRGRLVAYVGVQRANVMEYGGSTEDVAALLRAVFGELDDPNAPNPETSSDWSATTEMMVTTPDSTEGLPGLLLSRGIPNTLTCMGMILIVDAPGLFQALNIHDVQLEPKKGGWRLRHGEKSLDLSQRELVKLVFGPELYLDFAPEVFPVDFFQWTLDRV